MGMGAPALDLETLDHDHDTNAKEVAMTTPVAATQSIRIVTLGAASYVMTEAEMVAVINKAVPRAAEAVVRVFMAWERTTLALCETSSLWDAVLRVKYVGKRTVHKLRQALILAVEGKDALTENDVRALLGTPGVPDITITDTILPEGTITNDGETIADNKEAPMPTKSNPTWLKALFIDRLGLEFTEQQWAFLVERYKAGHLIITPIREARMWIVTWEEKYFTSHNGKSRYKLMQVIRACKSAAPKAGYRYGQVARGTTLTKIR